jgi:hypothetical protein
MKAILFFATNFFCFASSALAQGLTPPSEGKAVVYFCRPEFAGLILEIPFFDSTQFIGSFNSPNYLRHECMPGKHLFWSSLENKDFIEADLEANKTYIVQVKLEMGLVVGRIELNPLSADNKKNLPKVLKTINKKSSKKLSEEELASNQEHYKKAIDNYPEAYANAKTKENEVALLNDAHVYVAK